MMAAEKKPARTARNKAAERRRLAQAMGARIHDRRLELGLTLAELGRRVGRNYQRIQDFERNGVGTIALAFQLAQALQMDPCFLAFGPGTARPSND